MAVLGYSTQEDTFMRCFIAVDIAEDIRNRLGTLQRQLTETTKIRHSDVKWVHPEQMHLTLKFLGEVPDSEIVHVCQITEQTAARHRPFDLDIEGVGHFGGRSARVVWVGTGNGCQELAALQSDLEQMLDTAGWARDARPFSAHLTLGRVKIPQAGFALAQAVQEHKDLSFGTTAIKEIIVYESHLSPQGPIYTAAGRYAL